MLILMGFFTAYGTIPGPRGPQGLMGYPGPKGILYASMGNFKKQGWLSYAVTLRHSNNLIGWEGSLDRHCFFNWYC